MYRRFAVDDKFSYDAITMHDPSLIPIDQGHSQQNRIGGLKIRQGDETALQENYEVPADACRFSPNTDWCVTPAVWLLSNCNSL